MNLIFINNTFMRYAQVAKGNPFPPEIEAALFYNDIKKEWSNPCKLTDRKILELEKNKTEFYDRKWITLRKKLNQEGASTFIQEGPYSAVEVFDQIISGSLKLTDGIWTQGYAKWLQIRQTRTFKDLMNYNKPFEEDAADILSHVMDYRPETQRVEVKNSSPDSLGEVFIILDDK